ncbi:type 4a pilus biogenesis protein PilO [Candidatus Nomurabacteria bacterium]|nr:type 4a pilus biogenesis protein PilO [Candidatus Nomurabacteria bacterium]
MPIILLAISIGLFVTYTNPAYQDVKSLVAQASSYDNALERAQELRARRDTLLSEYNTFSTENRQRLLRALPDNVDNIRLIIDINNIAARHNLTLANVELGDVSNSRISRDALSVGTSGDAVGSVEVTFALLATYEDFLAFLQDLEHSLRIVDIESIGFTSPAADSEGLSTYTVTIRTYWLR